MERLSTFPLCIQEKRPIMVIANANVGGGHDGPRFTIKMPFTDKRAQNKLDEESKHLSENELGIIVLDVSGIPVRLQRWSELIKQILQLDQYKEIGAVLLVHISIGSKSMTYEKVLIEHPNPYHPIPKEFLKITEL